MSLVPWRGKRRGGNGELASPINYFRTELDQLFDRFFHDPWSVTPFEGSGGERSWMPSIDVVETDTEVTVRAEVAGVDPKDIEVTVSGQMLTLAGEKKEQSEKKGENFFHTERRFGSFRRSIQLPASVDTEKMTAEHKNGMLEIHLQKTRSATPRRIPVKVTKE